MPYVQRDLQGKITGLYARPQPGRAEEYLPEDEPDVRAFREKHPTPPGLLKRPTEKDLERQRREFEGLVKETKKLRSATLSLLHNWSFLETEMAHLFSVLIGSDEHLAFAAYFAIANFRSRLDVVDELMDMSIPETENVPRQSLIKLWGATKDQISTLAKRRNKLAHGTIMTVAVRGKNRARVMPPFFDFRESERAVAKRQIPGLGLDDVELFVKRLSATIKVVEQHAVMIPAIRQGAWTTLPEITSELESRLQSLRSLSDPNLPIRQDPPQPSLP